MTKTALSRKDWWAVAEKLAAQTVGLTIGIHKIAGTDPELDERAPLDILKEYVSVIKDEIEELKEKISELEDENEDLVRQRDRLEEMPVFGDVKHRLIAGNLGDAIRELARDHQDLRDLEYLYERERGGQPMTAIAIDRSRLAAIHAESKRLGLDDASRRDLMEAVTGKRSSRELTPHEADRVIERLKGLSNGHDTSSNAPSRPPRLTVSGPYAGKLRALWLSGYNLGVIQSKDDAALLAFAERQTGLSHTRFLKSPKDAARVIEALKAWLARDGGVAWPDDRAPISASKQAIVTAQLRRLAEISGGRYEPRTAAARDAVTLAADALASGVELDAAASRLGTVLRLEIRRRRGN